MYEVELYLRVRRACMVDGMSIREASRVFGLHRDTVRKMLAYSVPSPDTGDVRASIASSRTRPVRLRGGVGGHRRGQIK